MTGEGEDQAEQERPSVGELRRRVLRGAPRVSSGWPVVDDLAGGVPAARTTVVRGPSELRLQVLARLTAWLAGEGYPVILASHARTTEELWLAAAAGGLGLPPTALLTTTTHDAWVDARLRVLDLRVFGGADAPTHTAEALGARGPAVLVVDDYLAWMQLWDTALDPQLGIFDLRHWPRTTGCTVVLGVSGMSDFTDWIENGVLTLRLTPDEHRTRVTISSHDGMTKRHRTVPLRDGYLEPPPPGAGYVRREGVTNLWEDRSEQDISAFARALGSEVVSMVWERDEDAEPPEG